MHHSPSRELVHDGERPPGGDRLAVQPPRRKPKVRESGPDGRIAQAAAGILAHLCLSHAPRLVNQDLELHRALEVRVERLLGILRRLNGHVDWLWLGVQHSRRHGPALRSVRQRYHRGPSLRSVRRATDQAGQGEQGGRQGAETPRCGGPTTRWRARLGQVAIASAAAFTFMWAGYRFSVGRLDDLPPMDYIGTPVLPPLGQRSALLAWFCRLRLPAPEFWHGFFFLKAHDIHGHSAFLFGQVHARGGFWDFYLVGLLLKSPLPFLLLLVACLPALLRRGRAPLDARALGSGLAALAALALSTGLPVNIGLRHFLIVVPLLAIFIAGSLTPWLEDLAGRPRIVAAIAFGALLVASVVTAERACPQLMAYFNPLAGHEPGHALIDSDLDWGQDFLLLKRELRARQIPSVHYGFFGTMNPCSSDGPQFLPLVPKVPVTGWIVLSEQFYRSDFFVSVRRESCASPHYRFNLAPGDSFDWLKAYEPTARIGATLRLYYLPER